jgi:hypothetical protein
MIQQSTLRRFLSFAGYVSVKYHLGGLRSIQSCAYRSIALKWMSRCPRKG